jgi:hypothetical protein
VAKSSLAPAVNELATTAFATTTNANAFTWFALFVINVFKVNPFNKKYKIGVVPFSFFMFFKKLQFR